MSVPSKPLPQLGVENLTEDPKIFEALQELQQILTGGVDAANLATSAKPATLLGQYDTLAEVWSSVNQFNSGGSSGIKVLIAGGQVLNNGDNTGGAVPPAIVPIAAADLSISGLTTRLRVRAAIAMNGVNPASTFTFGLYPLAITGVTGNVVVTLGTVVAGSTVGLAPGTSGELTNPSADFALPADGIYCLGVSLSAGMGAGSVATVRSALQVRHI